MAIQATPGDIQDVFLLVFRIHLRLVMTLVTSPIGSEGRVAAGAVIVCTTMTGGKSVGRTAGNTRPGTCVVTIRTLTAEVRRGSGMTGLAVCGSLVVEGCA